MSAIALLVGMASCGGGGEDSDPATIGDLQAAIETDASCAELIEIKNGIDPKSDDYEQAPDVLRSVGCFSFDSKRTDQ